MCTKAESGYVPPYQHLEHLDKYFPISDLKAIWSPTTYITHCDQKLSAVGSCTPAESVNADDPHRLHLDK
jgi:hypothetical protein